MARIRMGELRRYLFTGGISQSGCLHASPGAIARARAIHTTTALSSPEPTTAPPSLDPPIVPIRKQLKDKKRASKQSAAPPKKKNAYRQTVPGWELTVGIEIHAQLNTAAKLFSSAAPPRSPTYTPANLPSCVAPFDLALPGSQPVFQPATLVPAVRAALVLGCAVQPVSRFDRKHYFWWDQPAGYQITQYYQPLARDGSITLTARDGIAPEDGAEVTVGIQQVQLEQDTAKTLALDGGELRLDFNRVGVPLVEIITRPDIHHPATAAALVRRVQALLGAVDACTGKMEEGGLRADINVSVRRAGSAEGLGRRTEIKNLSSFKAVEDAVIAERDRQIAVLEAGGEVHGETRGWNVGGSETHRLRGKEGEVDYRYMPDPDLGPVVVGEDLVAHLRDSMRGHLPDDELADLIAIYGLPEQDAVKLMQLDNGRRLEYFYNVLAVMRAGGSRRTVGMLDEPDGADETRARAPLVANWCLHELGKLQAAGAPLQLAMTPEGDCAAVPAAALAPILLHLHRREINLKVAKELLWAVFRGEVSAHVTQFVAEHNLWFAELSDKEYVALADEVLQEHPDVVKPFARVFKGVPEGERAQKKYPFGPLMFLVGQVMRRGPDERMDPKRVEKILAERMETLYVPDLVKSAVPISRVLSEKRKRGDKAEGEKSG